MTLSASSSLLPLQRQLDCKRVVVKIGSAMLTANGRGLDHQALAAWANQLAQLAAQGFELVLVSSGAVAEGMVRLGIASRPDRTDQLQACAAVGQMGLVEGWANALIHHNIQTAQVLLTHDDLADRQRYLNAGHALTTLMEWKVIPVINENDTVATDEIRFGDNDTLAAMVAGLVNAELLIILTDQTGMYNADPRSNPEARLLNEVRAMDEALLEMAGGGGILGRGGMVTKVRAARLAARAGCPTLIASGAETSVLTRLLGGEMLGTLFTADEDRFAARKRWLAAHLQTAGRLVIDAGAVQALRQDKRSLLPIGVVQVCGEFQRGDVVECIAEDGQRIAVGRVNFSSPQIELIKRQPSDRIASILGEALPPEIIHRDYLAVL